MLNYRERFRAEFKPAFEAWLKLDPENNPDTPSPFALPEHAPAQFSDTALFFGGITGRFEYRPVRFGMLALAGLMLLIRIDNVILMPKI